MKEISSRWGNLVDGKKVFRNINAQRLFDRMRVNSDVYEYGVDNCGNIFFAYLNGVVKRYSRKEFIKMATPDC